MGACLRGASAPRCRDHAPEVLDLERAVVHYGERAPEIVGDLDHVGREAD